MKENKTTKKINALFAASTFDQEIRGFRVSTA